MGRTKTGKEPLEYASLRLPRSLLDALKEAAAADDRTLSGYIRRTLADAVKKNEDKIND